MAAWPYDTTQWRDLRAAKLAVRQALSSTAQTFTAVRMPAVAVDHVIPSHPAVLLSRLSSGLRSLCASCHNTKTARHDMAGRKASARPVRGFDANGNPVADEFWHGDGHE